MTMAKKAKTEKAAQAPVERGEKLSLLNYYVPAAVAAPNPCPVLYPRAIHLDGSNWVIRRSQFPHVFFNNLIQTAPGAKFWIFDFDPASNEEIMRAAVDSLKDQIKDARKRLDATLDRHDAAEAEGADAGGAAEKRQKDRRGAVKRCQKLIKELEAACKLYGVDAGTGGLNARQVSDYAAAVSAANYDRTRIIAQLAEQTRGTEMERAAMADEVPVGVLADFVEDHGGDATKARIALGQLPTPCNGEEELAIQEADRKDSERAAAAKMARDDRMAQLPTVNATWGRDGRIWCVRTVGAAQQGQTAVVRRSNGTEQTVVLGAMVRHFPRNNARLWSWAEAPEPVAVPTPIPAVEAPKPVVKPEVTTAFLVRQAGPVEWKIEYRINCQRAVVVRYRNDEEQETMEMSRDEAKAHYAGTEASGYKVRK